MRSKWMTQVYPPRCAMNPNQAPRRNASRGVASRSEKSSGTKQTKASGQTPKPIQETK